MSKYFITSVADVYLYDSSDNEVARAKTLMDSSLESTLSNTDVRGGKGNALQYVYFQGADLNLTLTDAQFNMTFLQKTIGSQLVTGANVFSEETVTLSAGGAGTVTGTPIAYQGSTVYVWVKHDSTDTIERLTYSAGFTSAVGSENDVVCVRYYNADAAAKQITMNSNVIPAILRCELEVQLADSTASTNVVGKVVFTIPKLTLSGNFQIQMTPDGVANTPLTGRALAYTATGSGCSNQDVYGYITRVLDSANWYSDCTALAIKNGDLALTHPDSTTLQVVSVHSDGSVGNPPYADLTFASDDVGVCTNVAGLVTTVAAGTTYVSVTITAKPAIDAAVEVVVS